MAAMHMKGFVLQRLAESGPLWDYEVFDAVSSKYGVSGAYWVGTVRLTLTDLYSGGLLDQVETAIGSEGNVSEGKLVIRYSVNAFGHERMEQSGLGLLEVKP